MADPKGSCTSCPLASQSRGFVVEADGNGDLGVLIIGEALGAEEVVAKRQFVGAAGKLLNRMIERTKHPITGNLLERAQFKIANVLGCQPPNNELTGTSYEHAAIASCRPHLEKILREFKPKVILALGNQPLRWLTGKWGIDHWRGSVLESPWGWVVPTYHPAYLMRGQFQLCQVFVSDLIRAVEIAEHGVPVDNIEYLADPVLERCKDFKAAYIAAGRPPLASDIETSYSHGQDETDLEELAAEDTSSYAITRVSFSFRPGYALTVPWQAPYTEFCQELYDQASLLVWWNKGFDVPRLEADGINFKCLHFDAMWAHHFLQPAIPYNLQFASSLYVGNNYQAWKHVASENQPWYSCRDSDYTIRCYGELVKKLEAEGKAKVFHRHFTLAMDVFGRMSRRGVAVDLAKRSEAKQMFDRMLGEVVVDTQGLIPQELKPRKVFKISKERLEKKYGELGPDWILVQEELSQKEMDRIEAKERKRQEKEAAKAAKKLVPRKRRQKASKAVCEADAAGETAR